MTRPTDEWIITNPDHWSHWPFLPMVRRDNRSPNCGLIVGDPEDGVVWFVEGANLWDQKKENIMVTNGRNVTIDRLLAEGWVVD